MWQYFDNFLLILWKLHSWNLIKSPYFKTLSVEILSYGPLNSATHIFTHLERLLTISDRWQIAGACCPKQIKNHHFVICTALTSYLSHNHTELQSPRERWFCLLCWSTFSCFYGTIQGYTKRADAFSGVLRYDLSLNL